MEYLDGPSLADVIRQDGALEIGRALRLTNEIAQALATATKAGVTHRNLKPQNIMVVGPDDRAKVTDFGVARLRETASGARTKLGSGEYAAPEQLKSGEVTDRTDIYSLGAVLYTMLTGLPPSTPARSGAAGTGDLREAPTPVRKVRSDVPVALEQFVMRAMDRQPGLRQSGIWEFIDGLRELTDAVALGTAPASPSLAPAPTTSASVVPPPSEAMEPGPAASRPSESDPSASRRVGLRAPAPRPAEPESSRLEINGAEKPVRYADLLRSRRDSAAPMPPGLEPPRRSPQVSRLSRLAQRWLDAAWWQSRVDASTRRLPRAEFGAHAGAFWSRLARGKAAALDRELWRSRLAGATRGLAWPVDRVRDAALWSSSLQAWGRARTRFVSLPLDIARWSSRPGSRMVLNGAAGLVVVAVAAWAILSWPGGGARGPTPVATAPATVNQPGSAPPVVEQAPPVQEPVTAPTPVMPVIPERPRAEAARPEGERSRQVEAARRADGQRRQAELEAARRNEEQRRQAEAEAAGLAEEERRRQADAEVARRAEEEQRRQAESEVTRRAEEVAAARRQAEAEAARARAQAAPPVQVARPAEAPARPSVPALSAVEVARIRTQAEQKLTGRGLLRVSSSDRWGVMVDVGSTGEVALSGTLRDLTMYQEAIRLVREVPGVPDVKATGVVVSEAPGVSAVQYDSAGIRAEIQARLRTRGLLRESATDRWGVTVEVGVGGDVTLGGVVRDVGLQGEAIRLVQGVPGVQQVKQDIRVMEGVGRQGSPNLP